MSETEFDETAWRKELLNHRLQKDEFFAEHPQSPLPREDRAEFDGLDYYEPDPDYRVEATVELGEGDEIVEVGRTAGDTVEYRRVARLYFELEGEEYSLAAYRVGGDEELFVPFRDATSGEETYGAGRYLEFQVGGELDEGQTIPLDFNLAYSPFCAYNETFTCPLPPRENWLDVRVKAGERHMEGAYSSAN